MGKEKMGKRFTKTFSSFIVTLHKKHSNLNFQIFQPILSITGHLTLIYNNKCLFLLNKFIFNDTLLHVYVARNLMISTHSYIVAQSSTCCAGGQSIQVYQRGVVKPPGGILPLGLCGVADDPAGSSADTMTPGIPINSPVKGFTEIN